MPRPAPGIALAAIAAVLLCVLAPAASAAPPKVIRLISITTSDKNFDVKPVLKPSPGDHEDFTSRLVNAQAQFGKKKGAVVGSDRGSMMITTAMLPVMDTIAKLPGGTITVSGLIKPLPKGAFSIPVVGGTGIFTGVHGTLTILAPMNPKTAVNIYRLSYAPIA